MKRVKYGCLHCKTEGKVKLAFWKKDLKGTLTCRTCGETVDGKFGISKDGKKITTFVGMPKR